MRYKVSMHRKTFGICFAGIKKSEKLQLMLDEAESSGLSDRTPQDIWEKEEIQMTIAEISKMSVLERLQTMEELWDSLIREPVLIKSPKWHEEILSARKERIESGNADFISLEELKSKHGK